MIFKEKKYIKNQFTELFNFIDKSKIGEFMDYYDKVVFHTENGFIAAYRDDLNNYWSI